MRRWTRTLAAGLALLCLPTVAAVANHAPTAGPPEITAYSGTDGAGGVSLKVYGLYAGNGSRYVFDLRFSTRCSTKLTRVKAHIAVNGKYRFRYDVGGVAVSGSLRRVVSGGPLPYAVFVDYPSISGTVRKRTTACDSGPMKFTAKEQQARRMPVSTRVAVRR
ncbi:MAG: hypothetical protein ACYDHH_26240 [Solirubrobacteraceae bacterium]